MRDLIGNFVILLVWYLNESLELVKVWWLVKNWFFFRDNFILRFVEVILIVEKLVEILFESLEIIE